MIPTLRSVDHVAFTVPDLHAAVAFLVDHLGGELIFTDGPFADPDGDNIARRLEVHPRASCVLAMVRVGRINIELFGYDAPDQSTHPPRNSDIGGHHLAFYVDDVDAAYTYLAGVPGVTLMEGPNDVARDAPVAGQRWFYFTTLWGLHMEITSCTSSGFYPGLPGARMAPPADDAITAWRDEKVTRRDTHPGPVRWLARPHPGGALSTWRDGLIFGAWKDGLGGPWWGLRLPRGPVR